MPSTSFRIDFTDPRLPCARISFQEEIVPGMGSISLADANHVIGRVSLSAEGLRTLARSALALAEQVSDTEKCVEDRKKNA